MIPACKTGTRKGEAYEKRIACHRLLLALVLMLAACSGSAPSSQPEGDYWGVFTGNRGGATFVAVDDTSATVVDTGTMGDITFVKIIDLALDEVLFDFYDLNSSTGDANGYTLDNEEAAFAYALAYGYDPADYTVEKMEAMDYVFTQDSDNQITLSGNRGGGWTIVRVDYVDTVVDFGGVGDPFIVSVVDNVNGELVFQTPIEN